MATNAEIVTSTHSHPGNIIEEELFERKISYPDFAKLSGISERTLRDLVNARVDVDAEIAQKFEKGLGIASSFWLKYQKRYDEWPAKRAAWEAANPGWDKEEDEDEQLADSRSVVVENGFDDNAVLAALHKLLKFNPVKNKCKVMLTVEA